jgi:hypothetical protein
LSSETTKSNTKPSLLKKLTALLLAILGFIVFALCSALPIIAATAWMGGVKAYFIMVPIYGIGSYVITMWLVKTIDKHSSGEPTRAQKFFESQREHNTRADGSKSRLWQLAETGGFVGFAIACYFLGAIVAVLLVNYSTKVKNLRSLTIAGSVIFATTFVATYTGLFGLIFGY